MSGNKEDYALAKFVIKRLLWIIPVLLGVLLVVFTLMYITPGDPAIALLGTNYTEEAYDAMIEDMGLNQPFLTRYFNYVKDIVTKFEFGQSYRSGKEVGGELLTRIPTTLKLGLLSTAFTVIVGILFGLISATKQYSVFDYITTVFSMFFASMPNFWLGLVAIIIFSLKLHWLPATGLTTWKHWILPVLTQGLGGLAIITRMARSSMLEVIRADYIRTARAKGLKESVIIRRHALKNALIPVVTVVGMQIGMIMGGSVIIETIFNIPGLGLYMMTAINCRDYPAINASVLLISVVVSIMNLVVDVAYAYIDPRIKAQYTSKKKKKKQDENIAGSREGAAA